jgi:antitoxin component YwqK of YwqJK toxin-antitoxin module
VKAHRSIIFLALVAISLIIIFPGSAFSQQWKQYTNKDGSYRIEYIVGTTPIWKKYYNKDGTETHREDYDGNGNLESTTYYNSDGVTSRIEYPDGTTITYTYNSDGSPSKAVYSDGTTITYNADGSYTVKRPDGSTVVSDKDGNLTEYDKNGKIVLKLEYKEDTKSYQPHHYKEEKDGSITYYTYNKKDNSYRKEFTEHADGRVTWYDENGNVTEVYYPEKMVKIEGPEDKDLYGGNVKDIYYAKKVPPGVDKKETSIIVL